MWKNDEKCEIKRLQKIVENGGGHFYARQICKQVYLICKLENNFFIYDIFIPF